MFSPDFFVIKKLNDKAAVDTYTFDPMLFRFFVTASTLINFNQNNNLNKSL